jgi:Protein of unknown function (DUF3618)
VANKQGTADIEREIEQARAELATSLDQLVERTSPKRIAQTTRNNLIAWARTPQGVRVIAGTVGSVVALMVIARLRTRNRGD